MMQKSAPLVRKAASKCPASNSFPPVPKRLRAIPINLDAAVTHLEEEAVIEGLLHVTAVQAGSCMERFGDLQSMAAPGLITPLGSALNDSQNNRVISEAICLATPPDAPEPPRTPWRVVLQSESTDLMQAEAQICQRAALFEFYSAEALQAAANVRRQRRKVLLRALRALRASRETTQALLAGPASVLGSLTSRDEGDGM